MQPAIASMGFSYLSGLMDLTTVSPKYQVVIPKRVREQFGLAPGQQLQVIALPGRIELFKWVLREHSEAQAIQAVAVMQRGLVVDLGSRLAIASAQPCAARAHQARLYTLDEDFKDLHDVELMQRL